MDSLASLEAASLIFADRQRAARLAEDQLRTAQRECDDREIDYWTVVVEEVRVQLGFSS